MKTKEEILKNIDDSVCPHYKHVFLAMEVYSQQQAIAFAEWIHQNDWVYYPKHTGYWADLHTEGRVLSSEELYSLFLSQQKQ